MNRGKKNGNKTADDDDDRLPCKYGGKCFQKNPDHHKRYWHPPPKDAPKPPAPKSPAPKPEVEATKENNTTTTTTTTNTLKRKTPVDNESSAKDEPIIKKQLIISLSKTEVITKETKVKKIETPKIEITKPNDTPKNDETAKIVEDKKDDAPKTDDLKVDEVSKTDETIKKDEVSKKDEVAKKDDVKKDEVPKKDDVKKDEVPKQDEVPKKDEIPKKDEVTKKDEAKKTNEIDKNARAQDTVGKKPDVKKTEVEVMEVDKAQDEKIEPDKKEAEKPEVEPQVESPKVTSPKVLSPRIVPPFQRNSDDEDIYAEARNLMYKIYSVSMPNDFYKFYDFCSELKPSDPSTAFKLADLKLVGPYDILNGYITKDTPDQDELLAHWRYFYDPPEFQTLIKGNDKEGLHYGYWRDRPSSDPVFVATNCSMVSHKIKPVAENVFGAVASYLEERIKKANPFEKTSFFNLLAKLKAYAKTYDITLDTLTPKMKSREKNVVSRTIHGAGVVCPFNKKTQLGYRELSVTDNQLLKIVKKIDDAKTDEERTAPRAELAEVVRLTTIAGDECDFGTCLELGHDLLSTGCIHVQNAALAMFNIAYTQLERDVFLKTVEVHMKNRKKGCSLSVLPATAAKDTGGLY